MNPMFGLASSSQIYGINWDKKVCVTRAAFQQQVFSIV